jgi:GTP cyclohydrolase IA
MASRKKSTRPIDPLETIIHDLIVALGRKPEHGMEATPARAAEAWRVFTRGYHTSARDIFSEGTFEAGHDGLVVVRGIDFYSVCEHHLVPFFGRCHIAYLPSGRIAGLSKFARLVDMHARRLQVQERMTHDIAQDIRTQLKPHGVAVQMEARHMCMAMRGVEQKNADVVTSALLGVFKTDPARAAEFRALVARRDD